MKSDNRGTAIMLSMFAAVPVALLVWLGVCFLFNCVNAGGALTLVQVALALFAGFAFGLAIFRFLYVAQKTPG